MEQIKPMALAKFIRERILHCLERDVRFDLDEFSEIDVDCVWDYGPMGVEGRAWQHNTFELYYAELDDDPNPVFIAGGLAGPQMHRLQVLHAERRLFPETATFSNVVQGLQRWSMRIDWIATDGPVAAVVSIDRCYPDPGLVIRATRDP